MISRHDQPGDRRWRKGFAFLPIDCSRAGVTIWLRRYAVLEELVRSAHFPVSVWVQRAVISPGFFWRHHSKLEAGKTTAAHMKQKHGGSW